MNFAIKDLFHINASRTNVFEAISTLEGLSNWWTTQVSGSVETGAVIRFDFGDFNGPSMQVTEYVTNEKLVWKCVSGEHGWEGHTFQFLLDDNEGKTRIRFSHEGWTEQDDFYAACSFSWGRYLESLRQYCQTGTGEAFGSPGYRR